MIWLKSSKQYFCSRSYSSFLKILQQKLIVWSNGRSFFLYLVRLKTSEEIKDKFDKNEQENDPYRLP